MAQISREAVVSRVTEIAERVAERDGVEIVEVEFVGSGPQRLLRIYIDKPGGVTHADCEQVSRHVETVLDAEDVVPGEGYDLQVSSPGVERKLTKVRDFERFSGKKARIWLTEPVADRKHWEGTLRGVGEGDVIALESAEGTLVQIPLQYIRKANLRFDW
jgi:ribosome maturation factor RimP